VIFIPTFVLTKIRELQDRTFIYVISDGVVLENGNEAPTAGRISIFISTLFCKRGETLNEICVWFCAVRDRTLEPTPFSWAIKVGFAAEYDGVFVWVPEYAV